jgi:osmotically-inducible protein OsmY
MNDLRSPSRRRTAGRSAAPASGLAAALAALLALGACAPLVVGGAMVGTALVATDRRTSGTQIDDEAIELKARTRMGEVLGDRGHVSATSYNRVLLITGEVPTEADKALVGQTVGRIDNVRSVVNELAVSGSASLTSRSGDTLVTGRVKAAFVEAKDLMANSIKVVTERGTVYLMGRVTEREATRATELTRGTRGVQKVVRVFDLLSEAELAGLGPATGPASAPAASAAMPARAPGESGR